MKETEAEMILRLSKAYLQGEPGTIEEATEALFITPGEIVSFKLDTKTVKCSKRDQFKMKKIGVIEKALRKMLCEIAIRLSVVSVGKIIPTTNDFVLRQETLDGFLLADNPRTKIVEFFNPLSLDFLNTLQLKPF